MAKIVNSWNEWDPLEHVLLVDPTGSALTASGGMLHCKTLDIYREGDCVDYFPSQ